MSRQPQGTGADPLYGLDRIHHFQNRHLGCRFTQGHASPQAALRLHKS